MTIRVFADHPLIGAGAGNFGRHYEALRRYPPHSRYPRDLVRRVLSETGIVGLLPFVGLVVALVLATISCARRASDLGRVCAVPSLRVAAYFFVHASLDWFDELPHL